MTTATQTESIYLSRLREWSDDWNNTHFPNKVRTTRWQIYSLKPQSLIQVEDIGSDWFEQTIGGFQLVIHEMKLRWRSVNDLNGVPLQVSHAEDSEIGGYGTWNDYVCYSATAYRIGTDYDRIVGLSYGSQFSTFFGSCVSTSKDKTIKLATKKLEIYNLLLDSLGDLIPMCGAWEARSNLDDPYNVSVGDIVWVQAFGRLRQGKVIATTGSRFVVGYVTPSNQYELKYKIVPLSQLKVKK